MQNYKTFSFLKFFAVRKYLIIFLPVILIIVGCMQKIVPIASQNVIIQEEFGVIKTEYYDIAIKYQLWNDTPGDVNEYFTTFYLIYRNKSGKSSDIKIESFALLDSNNEQYDLFTSGEVVRFMYGDDVDLQLDYLATFPNDSEEVRNSIKNQINSRTEGIRNIKSKAFSFSPIRAQARKSGYLFFQKIGIKKNSTFKLFFNDQEIKFQVQKNG
ncbi:MAG: hypothetical protein U9P79_06100 [Candidatus Cloacimonadota bacterium]|nr:hypothetical protein [Candidatus Cloacimonadota bacterium]